MLSTKDKEIKRWARLKGAQCDICPCKDAPPVLSQKAASPSPKLIIVGEGPGVSEERDRIPFTGRSGKLLDALLLKEAGLSRSRAHILNAALCQGEDDIQKEEATRLCAPRLLHELGALPPALPIVTLGGEATGAVLGAVMGGKGKVPIQAVRGLVWRVNAPDDVEALRKKALKQVAGTEARAKADAKVQAAGNRALLNGRVVLPTLHPVFVLRDELKSILFRLDLCRVGRLIRGEINLKKLLDEVGEFSVVSGRHPKALARALRILPVGRPLSLDIETTETNSVLTAELLCVGVGTARRQIVIWPWDKRAVAPLSKLLSHASQVVGHNLMNFDKVVLERAGVR